MDGSSIRVFGKGSRDRVAYVADPGLRRELLRLIRARSAAGYPSGPLFRNNRGAPLRPQSIRSRLRRHAREAGLTRRVTPHMLRHTAATLLIESGVDIRFVQRLLGHSSIATTEIYTHVSDEALRTTLERADVRGCWRSDRSGSRAGDPSRLGASRLAPQDDGRRSNRARFAASN